MRDEDSAKVRPPIAGSCSFGLARPALCATSSGTPTACSMEVSSYSTASAVSGTGAVLDAGADHACEAPAPSRRLSHGLETGIDAAASPGRKIRLRVSA